MKSTAAAGNGKDEHTTFELTNTVTNGDILDAIHAVLDNQTTILENQAQQREQYEEIVEKLTNLGLERDDYPTGYRE